MPLVRGAPARAPARRACGGPRGARATSARAGWAPSPAIASPAAWASTCLASRRGRRAAARQSRRRRPGRASHTLASPRAPRTPPSPRPTRPLPPRTRAPRAPPGWRRRLASRPRQGLHSLDARALRRMQSDESKLPSMSMAAKQHAWRTPTVWGLARTLSSECMGAHDGRRRGRLRLHGPAAGWLSLTNQPASARRRLEPTTPR